MPRVHHGVVVVIGTASRISWRLRFSVNWRSSVGVSVVMVVAIVDGLWHSSGSQPLLLPLPQDDEDDQQDDEKDHNCDYDTGNTATCELPGGACQRPFSLQ